MIATIDTQLQVVALQVTVISVPGGAYVRIDRRSPSGTVSVVRGWDHHAAQPGLIVARDFEAPIGVELDYTARTLNGSGTVVDTQTATVTIPSGGCSDTWLNDLARVGNTISVLIEALPQLDYPALTTVHDVITRRDPIVTSDIAHTPAFELSVLTETLDERDRARAILGNGVPVLLRTPPEDGIGNLYFAVLGYSEQRIVTEGTVPDRRFVINGRQVTRPDPGLYEPVGYAAYDYVLATFGTYANVKAQRASYDAVLYDWAGTQPSDVVPWPPVDG